MPQRSGLASSPSVIHIDRSGLDTSVPIVAAQVRNGSTVAAQVGTGSDCISVRIINLVNGLSLVDGKKIDLI